MSTNTRPAQESDARSSLIGIDAEGSEHRWLHGRATVRVQRPDETVDYYDATSTDAWIDHVERACGWTVCHAQMTTAELIAEGLQNEA